ncbi:MAG: lipopolysaccharide assembly protein LapB [Rubrivivax sp. SCN 70-15]|jgi:lipopolysaccharide biosynthesis regulator YciM|nr:MAG: lipopolysaccharide assembly protein LapB [Rubrivivax sp. SCN 70-15]
MDFDFQWLLIGLPIAFALGWMASRFDLRQVRRDNRDAPRAYFKGLNLLLNEQQDKAIDTFIEAVQSDPDTTELHFALGNLFRRRGEFERAVRVHQHLLGRADLKTGDRDRAQLALAQDYMKAGLFDRAEAAWRALEGTPFDGEARLALLSLYERSRDWRHAAEVAARLEQAGGGSFASRIAHHWCEIALEAEERGRPDEAETALRRAREVAPQSPRPLVLAGERLARQGEHARALAVWDELRQLHPARFALVAAAYADSALACGRSDAARATLGALFAQAPSLDLLRALDRLGAAPPLLPYLQQHPTLSAAQQWLAQPRAAWTDDGVLAVRSAIEQAARPLQRYRCAACGFEAQHYFWQCPGCLSWDSYPPQRIEEL